MSLEGCIPSLRRYGRSLSRDHQEVDDLVHDCLVRALEQLHTRRETGDLRPWLFAIMHNLFVSRFRRAKRRGRPEALDTVPESAVAQPATQEMSAETGLVWDALHELPPEQRSVLVLVSVEDLSYADVARVLSIPIGTVMSRLSRGRERLSRLLEGKRGPDHDR
jgi:RNA polymerase sigma-70 factor (ECF subfamily)